MNNQRVGILGLGAIGSVMAGLLSEQNEIDLIAFNRSPVEAVRLQEGNKVRHIPIQCETKPGQKVNLDWLLICLKTYHYPEAMSWFENLIGEQTKVAIIRNGLDLKTPLLPYCPAEQLLPCLIDCPTERLPGRIFHALRSPVITCPNSTITKSFEQLFIDPTIALHKVRDFKTEGWKKLIESAALGAITCLSGESCWVFQQQNVRDLHVELVEEAIAVAVADGARVSYDLGVLLLAKLASYPNEKGSSMLTDRQQGRPIELDAKSGAIVQKGKALGIPTPLHQMVCTLLQGTNQKNSFPKLSHS